MKKTIYAIAFLLLGIGNIGNALADHRVHSHVGVVIGGPVWSPWYYPYPPPYYYPPVVIERAPPPVYIEQTPPPPPQTSYWYYCREAKGYYPYVKECPGGWQKVLPRPSDQP